MAIKGVLQSDIVQVNKYKLSVTGLIPMTFTAISGIEEELDTVDLPDRTTQSGGRSKPVEFEITQPLHHKLEVAEMEGWYQSCKDPISPFAKKVGTLQIFRQSSLDAPAYLIDGMIISKRSLPDLDLDNDGEMATVVWTIRADEVLPLA